MPVIKRVVSTSHPEATSALQALASLVGLEVTFEAEVVSVSNGSFSIEMKVEALNSFSGIDMGYTANGLLGCARAICKAVPESGLWGQLSLQGAAGSGSELESLIEGWIETAAAALIDPAYVTLDSKGKVIYSLNQVNLKLSCHKF
jgi:hypothetical protein